MVPAYRPAGRSPVGRAWIYRADQGPFVKHFRYESNVNETVKAILWDSLDKLRKVVPRSGIEPPMLRFSAGSLTDYLLYSMSCKYETQSVLRSAV